jgi:carboxypeptidase PM20D1
MLIFFANRRCGPILDAMLRDTVALTILEAGYKSNLVPGSARAVLSIRLLPGSSADAFTDRVCRLAGDGAVEIRRLKYKPPASSPFDTPMYRLIERLAGAPGEPVVPILSPAASDCRFWRAAGVPCYGWVPFLIDAQDLHSVHGPNERVSISDFGNGIEALFRAVVGLVT